VSVYRDQVAAASFPEVGRVDPEPMLQARNRLVADAPSPING
jgi:hypothetical protein